MPALQVGRADHQLLVTDVRIAPARQEDVPAILRLIRALADYEKLTD